MPNPNIKEIVDKVHSILTADTRTSSVNWERGDRPMSNGAFAASALKARARKTVPGHQAKVSPRRRSLE